MWCGWTRTTRRVIVGPKEALSTRIVPLREINWLGDAPFDSRGRNGSWRSRSAPPAPRARRSCARSARPRPRWNCCSPEDGVSPGQACVFYAPEGSRVLGGGWIWKGRG